MDLNTIEKVQNRNQEASLGLLKAIRDYRDDKKDSFTTFSSLCMRRHLISKVKETKSKKEKV